MIGKYDSYEPQNAPVAIGPGIWIVEGPVIGFGYGIEFPFPTRMTVVRLTDGGLWLHSPIHLTPDLVAAVEKLGPIRHLVSPNKLHHLSIGAWAADLPEALTWASPGVRGHSTVRFDRDLENGPPPEWADCIDQRIAFGSKALQEVVFFHEPSSTLILTDLIENFERPRLHGWLGRLVARAGGVLGPDGGTPRDFRFSYRKGLDEMRSTVSWMIACEPRQIVISHGKWFRGDSAGVIERAFAWVKPD